MENRYQEKFGKDKTLLVVIHVVDQGQALENIDIALKNGADGVFLINHNIKASALLEIFTQARIDYPTAWIGLNMLDQSAENAIYKFPALANGLWVDDGGIREVDNYQCSLAHSSWVKRFECRFKAIYFGSVAFKGQRSVKSPKNCAYMAMPFMDVITTSGPETGTPPTIDKIVSMRKAIGDFPLAIASGIDTSNVTKFIPYVDCFLVATGISHDFYTLDPQKVRDLADIIHGTIGLPVAAGPPFYAR